MRSIWLLAYKDIKNAFSGPLTYVLFALFSLISGWLFFNILVGYVDRIQVLPPSEQTRISFIQEVVFSLFGNLHFLLLFLVPILSMRLLAEEKKQQTMDLLWTAPITDWQIILGKYVAGAFLILSLFSVSLVYPIILLGAGLDDIPALLMCYFALYLNGLCYLSVGVLASSLTDQQIVAAVISFVMLFFIWMLNWIGQSSGDFWISETLSFLSLSTHFEKLVKGWFESSSIVYYVSFIFSMLYLSVKSLQSRLW
jgi:ABC-2 type transport system permease protein